ncbi:MAG: NAD-dependent epimerase/dehydratase family protein, partial [Actinomycetota bacterium]
PFLQLIDALEPRGLKRVVFSSSAGSIYRSGRDAVAKAQADTAYHSTKRSIEHYLSSRCAATGLTAVSLRISNPIGDLDRPGFGLVGHVARAVAAGGDIAFFGDYATPKDYVALGDVGSALAAAARSTGFGSEPGHHIVDVGSGWSIDAPGMYKVVRSLAEDGLELGRSPLHHGFGPSALDLEPMARLGGWQPRADLLASIDDLVRRHLDQPR